MGTPRVASRRADGSTAPFCAGTWALARPPEKLRAAPSTPPVPSCTDVPRRHRSIVITTLLEVCYGRGIGFPGGRRGTTVPWSGGRAHESKAAPIEGLRQAERNRSPKLRALARRGPIERSRDRRTPKSDAPGSAVPSPSPSPPSSGCPWFRELMRRQGASAHTFSGGTAGVGPRGSPAASHSTAAISASSASAMRAAAWPSP